MASHVKLGGMELSVMEMHTPNNDKKKNFSEIIYNNYQGEGCGICEKKGADVTFSTFFPRGAHRECSNDLKEAISALNDFIEQKFKSQMDRNFAFMGAFDAVKKNLEGKTMKEYLDIHGVEKLKRYFTQWELILLEVI